MITGIVLGTIAAYLVMGLLVLKVARRVLAPHEIESDYSMSVLLWPLLVLYILGVIIPRTLRRIEEAVERITR